MTKRSRQAGQIPAHCRHDYRQEPCCTAAQAGGHGCAGPPARGAISSRETPVNRVATFDELAAEFHRRVSRIVWCTLATVAPDGMPWTRVLHPVWEASTGWIATTRHGLKARHLAHEPRVSLTYWDAVQDVVTVHATADWADDAPTRERVWQLFLTTPPPLGYDPGDFWPGGPDDPAFGLLRLRPTRIDITGMASSPGPKLTWRPGDPSGVQRHILDKAAPD